MKRQVNELEGHELDAMVLVACGHAMFEIRDGRCWRHQADGQPELFEPSTNSADGAPIIWRERIAVYPEGNEWIAGYDFALDYYDYGGETGGGCSIELNHSASHAEPLVAAMRSFVSFKLGNEVDLP